MKRTQARREISFFNHGWTRISPCGVAASRQSAANFFILDGGFLPKAATLASAPAPACKFSKTVPRNLPPADAERDSPARPRPGAASRADDSPVDRKSVF